MRLQKLLPGFMEIAVSSGSTFIDVYSELKPQFDEFHADGIHLNENGSKQVALSISRFLDKTTKIALDDDSEIVWPEEVQLVDIISPLDGEIQKAYFYKSKKSIPQPLLVRLHTWSGDYTQKDELLNEILDNDWNYIHPDFRGPNKTSKACGSIYAIDDIDQAIKYAIEHSNVDLNEIHLIGGSGGGHATLCSFMNSDYNIESFSAWVPISDIEAWYYESAGRKNKYAFHILAATESSGSNLNVQEARRRSPVFMVTPVEKRRDSKLNIYAGIHDGYTGSVPVSQSLKFYNKVISDFGAQKPDLIPDRDIMDLVSMRNFPSKSDDKIGDRIIIYRRKYKNISITLFEGKHEMLSDVALKLLPLNHEN